jgi:hypothetical protein
MKKNPRMIRKMKAGAEQFRAESMELIMRAHMSERTHLQRTVYAINRRIDFESQHGPVNVIMKDGKRV